MNDISKALKYSDKSAGQAGTVAGACLPGRLSVRGTLVLILLFAFTVRVSRCLLTAHVRKDSPLYIRMAEIWVDEGMRPAFAENPRIPPLYLLLMAGGEWLGFGAAFSGTAVSVLAGSLLPLGVFLIARRVLNGERMALLAAFLAAIHPFLIRISAEIMRDSLFLFLAVFSLVFLVEAVGRCGRHAALFWSIGGVLIALTTMVRDEGSELLAISGIWVIIAGIYNWRQIPVFIRDTALPALLAVLFYGVISFPVWRVMENCGSSWQPLPGRIVNYLRAYTEGHVFEDPDPGEKS